MRRCSTAALINNEHDTQGAGLDVSTNRFVTPEKQLEAIVLTFPLENTLEPGMGNNESGCSHYLEEFGCVCVAVREQLDYKKPQYGSHFVRFVWVSKC